MTLRVAMAQMKVAGGAWEDNLARAEEMISRAARQGNTIVVLPECLDLGWMDDSALERALPVPGPAYERLACAAQAHSIYVAAGLTERDGDRLYNAAVLIGPDGALLLKHRKINELHIARHLYSTGRVLAVAETPVGNIALAVCADLLPEAIAFGHALCEMGAQLIVSPCAWAVPPDYDNEAEPYGSSWINSYTTLACQHGVSTVAASCVGTINCGPWKGHKVIGASLAVGGNRSILARGPFGEKAEQLLSVDIPLVVNQLAGKPRS